MNHSSGKVWGIPWNSCAAYFILLVTVWQLPLKLRNLKGFILLPGGAILLFWGEDGDLKMT